MDDAGTSGWFLRSFFDTWTSTWSSIYDKPIPKKYFAVHGAQRPRTSWKHSQTTETWESQINRTSTKADLEMLQLLDLQLVPMAAVSVFQVLLQLAFLTLHLLNLTQKKEGKKKCCSAVHMHNLIIHTAILEFFLLKLRNFINWQFWHFISYEWGLCALRHGIQISMEAILACHPARSTEWLDCHPKSCELWRIRTGPISQLGAFHSIL